MQWDPTTYLQFSDERSRPFYDLTYRIPAQRPRAVVDLGCGPGNLTATLSARWPQSRVLGIDSSPEMIQRAQLLAADRLGFALGDLTQWQPDERVDVIVCNAALQWVPDHRALLPRLLDSVAPGGYLAFQLPANFEAPSHRLLYELAAEEPYASYTLGLQRASAAEAATYLTDLSSVGALVDAWETTYVHVLPGRDAVFGWMLGTGARPVLQALPEPLREQFCEAYRERLRAAYPQQIYGTVLPFRRVFAVAHRL